MVVGSLARVYIGYTYTLYYFLYISRIKTDTILVTSCNPFNPLRRSYSIANHWVSLDQRSTGIESPVCRMVIRTGPCHPRNRHSVL